MAIGYRTNSDFFPPSSYFLREEKHPCCLPIKNHAKNPFAKVVFDFPNGFSFPFHLTIFLMIWIPFLGLKWMSSE